MAMTLDDPAGIPPLGFWEDRQDYFGRHWRLRHDRGPAKRHDCVSCAEDGIRKRALDWAQIHGETGDNPWAGLCAAMPVLSRQVRQERPSRAAYRPCASQDERGAAAIIRRGHQPASWRPVTGLQA